MAMATPSPYFVTAQYTDESDVRTKIGPSLEVALREVFRLMDNAFVVAVHLEQEDRIILSREGKGKIFV